MIFIVSGLWGERLLWREVRRPEIFHLQSRKSFICSCHEMQPWQQVRLLLHRKRDPTTHRSTSRLDAHVHNNILLYNGLTLTVAFCVVQVWQIELLIFKPVLCCNFRNRCFSFLSLRVIYNRQGYQQERKQSLIIVSNWFEWLHFHTFLPQAQFLEKTLCHCRLWQCIKPKAAN